MVGVFYSVDTDFGDGSDAGYSNIQISNVISNSAKDAVVFLEHIDNLNVTHVIQNCPNCSALKYMNEPLVVADITAVSGEPITSGVGYVHDISTYTTVVEYPEV